jgi:hypothetical protein
VEENVHAAIELDISSFAERGEQVPAAKAYRVRIDGESFRIDTPSPNGDTLLAKVGKRPCAFELIEEFVHHENNVVEPNETVDLRSYGLKGFITAHKEIVTVYLNGEPYQIERGERSVADILGLPKSGQTPAGYDLLEEKGGPPLPLPVALPVRICGCETFYSQPQSGGSA